MGPKEKQVKASAVKAINGNFVYEKRGKRFGRRGLPSLPSCPFLTARSALRLRCPQLPALAAYEYIFAYRSPGEPCISAPAPYCFRSPCSAHHSCTKLSIYFQAFFFRALQLLFATTAVSYIRHSHLGMRYTSLRRLRALYAHQGCGEQQRRFLWSSFKLLRFAV